MIGVDTNVVLRFYVADDQPQFDRVQRLARSKGWREGALVNPIVLSEATWTLARLWKRSRAEIADLVERILETEAFVVVFPDAARRALESYRNSAADYADCLIAEINRELGASTTFTFDEDAQPIAGFSAVP